MRSVIFTVLLQVVTVVGPGQVPTTTKTTSYNPITARTTVELVMPGSWVEGIGMKRNTISPTLRFDCTGGKLRSAVLEVRYVFVPNAGYGLRSRMDGKRINKAVSFETFRADEIGPAYTLIDVKGLVPDILRSHDVLISYVAGRVNQSMEVVNFTVDGAELIRSACGLK